MILLVADEAARGRRGRLRDVRVALDAMGVEAEEVALPADVADRPLGPRDRVLVVGDDAITCQVASAILSLPASDRPSLGIVGSVRNDFVRTFGLDRGPFVAIQHATSDTTMEIDAMHVEVGGEATTALNAVEVGWGALVRQQRGQRDVKLRHRIAAARQVDDQATVKVVLDHTTYAEPLSRVIVANGQFLGDEGRVSPRALPDDGRFNVQSWGIFGDELARGPDGLHVGEHLGHERIREHQSATATIESESPLPVAVDGIVVGTTPVSIRADHRALRLHV
ncbi:MAG: hypothetical protein R3249_08190 [Nitriliruptorales bacterium]|nr:hypothetical protein [Nitriliruptorales bacterium]